MDGCFWAGRSYLANAPVHASLHELGVQFDRVDVGLSVWRMKVLAVPQSLLLHGSQGPCSMGWPCVRFCVNFISSRTDCKNPTQTSSPVWFII